MTDRDIASFVKEPRNIVLKKKPSQVLGINIVGGKDGYGIFVESVVVGGLADVTGELRRGDQLLKVNGIDLRYASHQEAVNSLKTTGKTVKIVAQYRPQEFAIFERKVREQQLKTVARVNSVDNSTAVKPVFVRALFDFDPTAERWLPSKGLAFSFGDILHVVRSADQSDEEWWQARRVLPWTEYDSAGVIPSKARAERRKSERLNSLTLSMHSESELSGGSSRRRSFSMSKKMQLSKSRKSTDGSTATEFVYESGDIAYFYEPVVQLQVRYTRPIVIVGPLKDHIYDELMAEFPDKYGGCVPHTSRPRRSGEVDGVDYHFVESRSQMEQDTKQGTSTGGQYVEVGVYNGHLYGLTAQSIKAVALQGKHCILDVTADAIIRLQAADLFPIAILVKPATPTIMTSWDNPVSEDEAKRVYSSSVKLLRDYSKYFTAVVKAESPAQVYSTVKQIIEDQSQPIVWVSSGDSI
jgi:guanylate kinase